jgi:hypothetical protein
MSLDDLLRYEEDEPTPHRAATPPPRYRWLIRPVVISLVGALVGGLLLRVLGAGVPYTLIFAILLAAQLLYRWLRSVDPQPIPRGLRLGVFAGEDDGPRPTDGLQLAVTRWDTRLSWVRLQNDPHQFARTIQPRLIQLIDERLRLRHGIVRSVDPVRARAVLGDPLWTFMTTPVRAQMTPADLSALIRQMEGI